MEEDPSILYDLAILLMASEWDTTKGGISAFNMELARLLHTLGFSVWCAVPSATHEQVAHAKKNGVTLLIPDPVPGVPEQQAFQLLLDFEATARVAAFITLFYLFFFFSIISFFLFLLDFWFPLHSDGKL